jgi:hypothetical protein
MLAQSIYKTFQKLDKKNYPDTGHEGYMMPQNTSACSQPQHCGTLPMYAKASFSIECSSPRPTRKWHTMNGRHELINMRPSAPFKHH